MFPTSRLAVLQIALSLNLVSFAQAPPQAPAPPLDPHPAVTLVSSSFAPNPAVPVEGAGKPLPGTGSWGAQTSFPEGTPQPCRMARVPCVRVFYRVPEQKLVCSWTVGYVVISEPKPDGTLAHTAQAVLLDEDAMAARYTMQVAWPQGTPRPQRKAGDSPVYPAIARAAHLSGTVGVRLLVGPDGKVKSIVSTAGPGPLAMATADALKGWTYEPNLVGQQPVSFRTDVYFTFDGGAPPKLESYKGGSVMLMNADPRVNGGVGFRTEGANGISMESCNAMDCTISAPPVPR